MRVIQLAGYDGPYGGSFISMLEAVGRAAAERGWEGELLLPSGARERDWAARLEHGPMRLTFTPDRRGTELDRTVRDAVKRTPGPAVLHSHFSFYDMASARAARGRSGTAFVWHLHSRLEPSLAARVRNQAKFRLLGRGIARVLCVAPNILDSALARGAPRDRTELWPNAIDVERFALVGPEERAEARRKLGLPDDRPVLLHFGWDWERKGGDRFLEAAALLSGRRPIAAVTVGGGAPARELAATLGVSDSVWVLEPQEDARSLHAAADVFLSPSRAEGMPFAMAEALAAGVPVVATDIPGQVLIGQGLDACRLVPGEPDRLAAAAAELLNVSEAARAAARAHIESAMGLGAWADRLARLYAVIAG